MPFCTTCGANVTGAFCNQCGTPAAGVAAPPPPPATPYPPAGAATYAQPGASGVTPAARKTSPIVWVLVIFGFYISRVPTTAGLSNFLNS